VIGNNVVGVALDLDYPTAIRLYLFDESASLRHSAENEEALASEDTLTCWRLIITLRKRRRGVGHVVVMWNFDQEKALAILEVQSRRCALW
jgi:hypothetical protein